MPPRPITEAEIDALLAELEYGGATLTLDPTRRAAIIGYDDVQACPGGGKTTLVALKLILLARSWTDRRSGICVLTHTNVAKDEIVERLRGHPDGRKLLSYPHFVGTIQDFVHTFLALPWLRSNGADPRKIDDETTTKEMLAGLSHGAKYHLEKTHASIAGLRFASEGGKLKLKVPGFDGTSDSKTYKELTDLRVKLLHRGFFFYSEMYAFALEALNDNPALGAALSFRFPVVLLDEMQDATKDQDEFLHLVFGDGVVVQRLGDPDQAIFDGMGGAAANESYNQADLVPIVESNRFPASSGLLLRGLSTKKISLTGLPALNGEAVPWAILVYDNESIGQVIESFASYVAAMPENLRGEVKAVGAIASSEGNNALNIRSYWEDFDRPGKVQSAPASLCEAVRACSDGSTGSHAAHGQFLRAVVELLSLAKKRLQGGDGVGRQITLATLRRYLRANGDEQALRLLAAELHLGAPIKQAQWDELCSRVCSACGIDPAVAAIKEYLAYSEENAGGAPAKSRQIYEAGNGLRISVATIHAVKGETHDATLVLETKHRGLADIAEMIPYLIDDTIDRPVFNPASLASHPSLRAGIMKKLYVAASRARHVVCMAIHRDRISVAQLHALKQKGWAVVEVKPAA